MIGYLVAGAGILTGIGIALWSRLRMARTYRQMEEMLEAALNGSFAEGTFDESRLSALENQLHLYLPPVRYLRKNGRNGRSRSAP